MADADTCLEMSACRNYWSEASWRKFLQEGERDSELLAIRRSTYSGRAPEPAEFIEALEQRTHRRLTPGKLGRPRKPVAHEKQQVHSLQT